MEIEVLAASFSHHTRGFHTIEKEGNRPYLFRLQTEGVCRITAEGSLMLCEPGDLLIFPKNEYYELLVAEEQQQNGRRYVSSSDYFVFFQGDWADEWWSEKRRPQKINISFNEEIVALFRQIVKERRRSGAETPQLLIWYMKILCTMIDRVITARPDRSSNSLLAYKMRNFVEENITLPFKLEDVARHAGISVSGAVHMFKSTFGQSIMQYALDLRLATARDRMLYGSMALEHVAEISGFANYTYFHRVFKTKYGMSPSQYRLTYGALR